MEKITVKLDNTEDCRSVLEALQRRGIDLNVNCAGMGRCGKCKVRVIKGELKVSVMDKVHLSREEIAQGIRLACQAMPEKDCVVEVMTKMGRF